MVAERKVAYIIGLKVLKPIFFISTPVSFIELLKKRALFVHITVVVVLILQVHRETRRLNQTNIHLALMEHRDVTLPVHLGGIKHFRALILRLGLADDHIVMLPCGMQTSLHAPLYQVTRRVNDRIEDLLGHAYLLLDLPIEFLVVCLHDLKQHLLRLLTQLVPAALTSLKI